MPSLVQCTVVRYGSLQLHGVDNLGEETNKPQM